jgi:CelD/BcsL family acetyltransferase involved in cellulose biosynthesis
MPDFQEAKHVRVSSQDAGGVVVEARTGGGEMLVRLADEWRAMCAGGPWDLPFFRPEWFIAHAKAYEPEARIDLITARSGGTLVAVLPVVRDRVRLGGLPVRRLRGLSNEVTERFDMACRSEADRHAVVEAVWAFLRERDDWEMLEFSQATLGGALDGVLDLAAADGFPVGRREAKRTPFIPLDGPVEDTVALARSGNLRKTLRKTLRRIGESKSLRLLRWERADPDLLARFAEMENAGWKQDSGLTMASSDNVRIFIEELTREGERLGTLAIYGLEYEDRIIGWQIGFIYGTKYVVPKCAHDESYREISPGHLLVNAILGDLIERGVEEFDFLGSALDWKTRWTDKGYDHAYLYVFRPNGRGRFLHWFKFTVKPAARRLLGHPD